MNDGGVTQQLPDLIHVPHHVAKLCEVDGEGTFDPASVGIETVTWHTACWRGYIATFSVDTGFLELDAIDVAPATTIDGVPAAEAELFGSPAEEGEGGAIHFEDVGIPVGFTGRIAAGYGESVRVVVGLLGAPPAWTFEHAVVVEIREGEVLKTTDRSEEAAAHRAKVEAGQIPNEERWLAPFAWLDLADEVD